MNKEMKSRVLKMLKDGVIPKGRYSALFPKGFYKSLTEEEGKEMYRQYQQRNIWTKDINKGLSALGIEEVSILEKGIDKLVELVKFTQLSGWSDEYNEGWVGCVICEHNNERVVIELPDDFIEEIDKKAEPRVTSEEVWLDCINEALWNLDLEKAATLDEGIKRIAETVSAMRNYEGYYSDMQGQVPPCTVIICENGELMSTLRLPEEIREVIREAI
jgi:hypothetical protein